MRREPSAPSPRRAESVRTIGFVGGVLGTSFAVALGFGLIAPALSTFATQLGAEFGAAGAVIATFAAVRLLFNAPAGSLTDRFGARPIVALGLLIVAVSAAATGFATDYVQLLVLRGAGGVGSAMFIVGLNQHIVRSVPSAERGRANGLLQGTFLLGGVSGPAVGGFAIDLLGIRAPFLIYAGTLLAATVLTLRYLGEGSRAVAASGDRADADGGTLVPSTAAAAGGLGPVLRDRTFWAALAVYAAISWASQGTRYVAIPLLGSEILGGGGTLVGLALTASSIAQGALLWPVAHFADTRGRRLPLIVGSGVAVVAMLGMATVAGPVGLVLWSIVQGAANGMASPIPAAVVGDVAPPDAAGRAVGVMNIARDIGAVLGPLVTGFVAQIAGFDAAFLVAAGLLVVGFAATFLMRETLEVDAGDEAELPAA